MKSQYGILLLKNIQKTVMVTVKHKNGDDQKIINQKKDGGQWIPWGFSNSCREISPVLSLMLQV